MPVFCITYGGFNQFSQETNKRFYKVPMSVVHIGGKCKKQTEEHWKKLQPNFKRTAESDNSRVCRLRQ